MQLKRGSSLNMVIGKYLNDFAFEQNWSKYGLDGTKVVENISQFGQFLQKQERIIKIKYKKNRLREI